MTTISGMLNAFSQKYLYWFTIPHATRIDIVEIIIIAVLVYYFLVWVKNTRVMTLLRGVVVIGVFVLIAAMFQMNTILWLVNRLIDVAIIALAVIFQPELRKALEQLGKRRNFFSVFTFDSEKTIQRYSEHTVNEIMRAVFEMAKAKTGALIVMQKEDALADFERTGIKIDSAISSQLIINIFEKNTPLHDGAVIVSGDRIVAATCYLPLSDNMNLDKNLGTRHRAAVGISEVTDSVTIIVSEETGGVSVAAKGKIEGKLDYDGLKSILTELSIVGYSDSRVKRIRRWIADAKQNRKADNQ